MSDKEMLETLRLSEHEASKAIGRSRQSLNQAKLSLRNDYFKKGDITTLVFEAVSKTPDIDLTTVYEYVAATRGLNVMEDIQRLNISDSQEDALLNYEEIWIVIPDFIYLSRMNPEVVGLFKKIVSKLGEKTTFFVSSYQDKSLLLSSLGENDNVNTQVETWMGAIPYLLIGNPHSIADSYLFSKGRYIRHDWYGGPKLALLIDSLAKNDLVVSMKS